MELVKRIKTSDYLDKVKAHRHSITDEFPVRPSWCDAALCLKLIKQKKADGHKVALTVREYLQSFLFYMGWFIQRYYFVVLSFGTLIFILFAIGCVKIKIETNIEKLWVPRGGRLENERNFAKKVGFDSAVQNNWTIIEDKTGLSDASATNYQVLIQNSEKEGENILERDKLLMHARLLTTLATFNLTQYGRNWTLMDICFKPKTPKMKGGLADILGDVLDNIIPCVMITPLDCFWEGSKALGPFPPNDKYLSFSIAWKDLNPKTVMSTVQGLFGDLFPDDLQSAADMFDRAGIGSAYQERYCIDPLDPECPETAKNALKFCPIVTKFLDWNKVNGNYYQLPAMPVEEAENDTFDYKDEEPAAKKAKPATATGSGLAALFGGGANDTEDDPPECGFKNLTLAIRDILRANKTLADRFITGEGVNYGKRMTGGCSGFATKFMKWPEELIIGGIKRNDKNEIVTAEALQSILMIANHNDLYQRFLNNPKFNYSDWTPQAALRLLKNWQRKYTKIIYNWPENLKSPRRVVHPLAAASIEDMVDEFSKFNMSFIFIGYVLMIIYACLSALSFARKGVRSCTGLAMIGCIIVILANVSGLGCTLIMGMDFNATTTQIVPFLLLAAGVDEMFLLLNKYRKIVVQKNNAEIAILLRESGLTVLISYFNNIAAFFCGGMLPLPALQAFCVQVAVVLIFNLIAILTLFPAVMTIDLIRQRNGRVDCLCCFRGEKVEVSANKKHDPELANYYNGATMQASEKNGSARSAQIVAEAKAEEQMTKTMPKITLTNFVRNYYAPIMQKFPMKIAIIVAFGGLLIASIVGLFRIPIGLELSEIVPSETPPHAFLVSREKYFPFYPIYGVIRGPDLEYSDKKVQRLLRAYIDEIRNVSYVVNMELKSDWPHVLADWLKIVQDRFDLEWAKGTFNDSSASIPRMAKVGYRLMCNKGDTVDCANRVGKIRLVDSEGLVNEDNFYNCLTAWINVDAITAYASQANFYPAIPRWDQDSESDKIPPASKLIFSQFAFFVNGLYDTPITMDMISKIRAVCDKYNNLGLPVFPLGIPFTFWELYLHLTNSLLIAFAIISAAVFVVISLMLVSPWTAALIVLTLLVMIVIELGFMGLLDIKLNPISAVTLLTAVGIRVKFTVHVALSFLTTVGTRNERVLRTLHHMFVPVLHAGVSTLVGIIMLAFSKFEFIVRYFFLIMFALVILGILSGLILMPVILSWFGPPAEVQPIDGSSFLSPPDPDESKVAKTTSINLNNSNSTTRVD